MKRSTGKTSTGLDNNEDQISEEEKESICKFYEIVNVSKWIPNNQGLVNITYELDREYFLTVHRRKTREQIEAIAQIANGMDEEIPIVKPLSGKHGYSAKLMGGHTLLNPRLPGSHYVGVAHTEKHPIPAKMHKKFAKFFWELQEKLSAVSEEIKKTLSVPKVINIGEIPAVIPAVAQPLIEYGIENDQTGFHYPDLIHDDMERQNILTEGTTITGVVDLDSIRTGDILYEFGHFLFNFALCDPEADESTIAVYIDELVKRGMIKTEDIPLLYSHIYKFVISDIIEFEELSESCTMPQHKKIDIKLLVRQYQKALSLAAKFFNIP